MFYLLTSVYNLSRRWTSSTSLSNTPKQTGRTCGRTKKNIWSRYLQIYYIRQRYWLTDLYCIVFHDQESNKLPGNLYKSMNISSRINKSRTFDTRTYLSCRGCCDWLDCMYRYTEGRTRNSSKYHSIKSE